MGRNIKECFILMRIFLEEYYNNTRDADIGGLLGDTTYMEEYNTTADPAAWIDWEDAVAKITGNVEENDLLDMKIAFLCVIEFLYQYGERVNSVTVLSLVNRMKSSCGVVKGKFAYWLQWQEIFSQNKKTNN